MEGFSKRAQQWGEEVSKKASEFGATASQKHNNSRKMLEPTLKRVEDLWVI